MPQIFISYRRGESGYVSWMLDQRLKEAFGPESVFIDIESIPLGVDFLKYLSEAVARCDIFLAVIGDDWSGPIPGSTQRRIDSPMDFVRIEVEAALSRNIPVVPVLIGNANMPAPEHLPPSLQPLAFRNAAEIRAGHEIDHHIETLIRGLRAHFDAHPSKPESKPAVLPLAKTDEPPKNTTENSTWNA